LKRYGYTDGKPDSRHRLLRPPLRFTYDTAVRVTSWTDSNDRGYTYEYDEQDRCTAEGGSAGHMSLRISTTTRTRKPATG